MTAPITVEPVTEATLAHAIAIDFEAFGQDANPTSEGANASASHQRAAREESLRSEIQIAWSRIRTACNAHGHIVGFVLFWHIADEIQLLNIAVTHAARRQGVARALMNDLITYAKHVGAERIILEVRADNTAAIALYSTFGFASYNIRKKYYPDGQDAVEMQWALSSGLGE